jgi:hypothetical protein
MTHKLLLILILLCLPLTSLRAQEYQLRGTLRLEGDPTKYQYKLVFTDSAGIIKGYSYSGHINPDERQAAIEGTLDTQKGTFEFRETALIFLSLKYDLSCLAYGYGHFRSERKLAWILADLFFYTPAPCVGLKAKINMNPDDALNERLTGFNPSAPKLLRREQTASSLITDTLMEADVQQLTTTTPVQLNWQGSKLNLMLMDDKEEDRDQLSLILNGEALVREQVLTKKEYIIEAELQPGLNKLVLHAENEGSLPPNTARILLWNETQRYVIHSVINAGRDAVIEITAAD